MKVEALVVWSLAIIVIVFVIIGIFYYVLQPSVVTVNPDIYTEPYLGLSVWSPVINNDDTTRGNCQIYTFPASVDTTKPCVNGTCYMVQGMPTNSPSIVGKLQPTSSSGCYDRDQLSAFQGTRECLQIRDSQVSPGCVTYDGDKVPIKSLELVYTHSGFTRDDTTIVCNSNPCEGTLAIYAVNYLVDDNNAATNGILCLRPREDGNLPQTIALANCSIADSDQLAKISKTTNTSSKSKIGNTAQYASIYFRKARGYLNVLNTLVIIGQSSAKTWLLVNSILSPTRFAPQQTIDVTGLTSEQVNALFANTPEETITLLLNSGLRSLQKIDTRLLLEPYVAGSIGNKSANASSQYIDYSLFNQMIFGRVPYNFPN